MRKTVNAHKFLWRHGDVEWGRATVQTGPGATVQGKAKIVEGLQPGGTTAAPVGSFEKAGSKGKQN
jgi:hypothetical protein